MDLKKPLLPSTHHYRQFLGKENKFIIGDDEISYNNNLLKFGKKWHYANKEIIYKSNSLCYRTEELDYFKNKDFALILGSSDVYGIGLAEDEIWHHQIKNKLGLEILNAGFNASGPDIQMLNSMLFLKNSNLTPKAVVIQWPNIHRFTFKGDNLLFPLVPVVSDNIIIDPSASSKDTKINNFIKAFQKFFSGERTISNFYRDWLKDNNSSNNSKIFIETTRMLWSLNKVPYYEFFINDAEDSDNLVQELQIENLSHLVMGDLARDQIHHGDKTHEKIGLEICKKLEIIL